jgi:hypothetical protein
MQLPAILLLVATAAQAHCTYSPAHCHIYTDAHRHLPSSRGERKSRRQGLVRNPPDKKCKLEAGHRKSNCHGHTLLLLLERGQRRDRSCWRNDPLHFDPAGQSPGSDTVLPREGPHRGRREDMGWKWCGVVQDQHHEAVSVYVRSACETNTNFVPTTLAGPLMWRSK